MADVVPHFGGDGGFVIFSGKKTLNIGGQVTIKNVGSTVRRRNQREKKNIPIFLDLIKYTTDPWWISFLEQASQGRFPRHYSGNNTSIVYKYKKKTSLIELEVPNQETFDKIREFMWNTSNYESETDTFRRTSKIKKPEKTILSYSQIWSKIKSSSKKLQIEIYSYLENIKNKYNLTIEDIRLLASNLKFIINSEILNENCFRGENGILKEIVGFIFDEKERKTILVPSGRPKGISFSKNNSADLDTDTTDLEEDEGKDNFHFMDNWYKFVKNASLN